jgi:hypothetical protein
MQTVTLLESPETIIINFVFGQWYSYYFYDLQMYN